MKKPRHQRIMRLRLQISINDDAPQEGGRRRRSGGGGGGLHTIVSSSSTNNNNNNKNEEKTPSFTTTSKSRQLLQFQKRRRLRRRHFSNSSKTPLFLVVSVCHFLFYAAMTTTHATALHIPKDSFECHTEKDNDDDVIRCSFVVSKQQPQQQQQQQQHKDDNEDDNSMIAKEFLTACHDDVCLYTHITARQQKTMDLSSNRNTKQQLQQQQKENEVEEDASITTKSSRQSSSTTTTATTTPIGTHDDGDAIVEAVDDDEVYNSNGNNHHAHDDDPASSSSSSRNEQYSAHTIDDHHDDQQEHRPQFTIKVGQASYHPPYDSYGHHVAAVLSDYPTDATTKPIANTAITYNLQFELPCWYIELGNAHLMDVGTVTSIMTDRRPTTSTSVTQQLYHAELARNAYQVALQELSKTTAAASNTFPNLRMEMTATAHFQLGETYTVSGMAQAQQQHYQQAYDGYKQLQQEYSQAEDTTRSISKDDDSISHSNLANFLRKQRLHSMDKAYADTCTKLGMVVHNRAVKEQSVQSMNIMTSMNSNGGGDAADLMASLDLSDSAGFGGGNNPLIEGTTEAIQELLRVMQEMQNPQSQQELQEQLEVAANYVAESILIYKVAEEEVLSTWVQPSQAKAAFDWYVGQALAYQQAATIATTQNRLQRAEQFWQDALEVYRHKILPRQGEQSAIIDNNHSIRAAVGSIHISLATIQMQLGQYDAAKRTYKDSMDWHEKYDLPAAPFASIGGDDGDNSVVEETVQLYRQQLEEYRRLVQGGGDGMYYMPQDDNYEGDLLSAMGSLYLSMGEDDDSLLRGMGLLQQALELYGRAPDSKRTKRSRADTQLNLAMAYFRNRQFEESIASHFVALDLYQELYGDGVNPLKQATGGMEDILIEAGLGDVAEQIKDLMQQGEQGVFKDAAPEKSAVTVDMEKYHRSKRPNATEAGPTEEEKRKREVKEEL